MYAALKITAVQVPPCGLHDIYGIDCLYICLGVTPVHFNNYCVACFFRLAPCCMCKGCYCNCADGPMVGLHSSHNHASVLFVLHKLY
jgi:hypothetical protein